MRTELVSASAGEPRKPSDLIRIDEAGLPRPISDQGELLRQTQLYADFVQERDESELAGLQGMMRVGNAYRAIDRIRAADMLKRRKHRIDMIV